MGTVFNKFGGGGGAKVIDLGTGTSFNVSSYSGYRNFTNDNFIVCAKSGSYSQSQNMGNANSVANITPSASCGVSVTKSYDASTGVLTANEKVNISASCSMYRDGNFSKSTPAKSYTNAVQVYLVIGKIS
jgi:hypothetical protein